MIAIIDYDIEKNQSLGRKFFHRAFTLSPADRNTSSIACHSSIFSATIEKDNFSVDNFFVKDQESTE